MVVGVVGMVRRCWIGLLLLLGSGAVLADSPVWLVERAENKLYLAGTVHLLSASDLPLPAAFDRAYRQSERVYLETDLGLLQSQATQQRLMQSLYYPPGEQLDQYLPEKLQQRLRRRLEHYGASYERALAMKPAGVMLMLLQLELQRLGIQHQGADMIYYQRARQQGKPLGGLESVDQHLYFISSLGEGREAEFIDRTLNDVAQVGQQMPALVAAWRQGDLQRLQHLVIDEMREQYPDIHRQLLTDRNRHWLPQIEQLLEDAPVEMVLVGIGHLVGAGGLLQMLSERGYKISQLP
ncbi:TraB/GumN family protein [Marinobacterium arenosum]|uniref:TraB/GumN family protein n=1 Tax=Marinobacterium arenosum TaxID=2862496 RepID=UPI001C93D68E|nr:TraB/GumN family protein [Marinobacterium arenosum]MBY4677688.1 TraB/GumN family protein [Marinobacterium arenosum]